MHKILELKELKAKVQELKKQKQRIVLAGGCFDILHKGHIAFLEAAGSQGDCLIVMLESDARIRKIKGTGKPIHSQRIRAKVLAALPAVDYILLLPEFSSNTDYEMVVLVIKPAIIAATKGDPGRVHLDRQAKQIGARVIDVIDRLPEYASSSLAEKITQL
jgi:FAD synthetase